MRSNYKQLGNYIREVTKINSIYGEDRLRGISSIYKCFNKSKANTIGVDFMDYKIVENLQFAFNPNTARMGDKIPIALNFEESIIVSKIYPVFEITNQAELLPEYLLMWFKRSEFDRYARFKSHGSAREIFSWEEMYNLLLPIPHSDKQREIIKEYNTIVNRIELNNQLIKKLEETVIAIYREWFVDYTNGNNSNVELGKYIQTNPPLSIKKDDIVPYVEMSDLSTDSMCINNFIRRPYSAGSKFQNNDTLLARITPCLENGKTGFVNFLQCGEIAYGSTEFIVLRAKSEISPFWVYCLTKDERFRSYAISSMIGSSGRERVHEEYLSHYLTKELDKNVVIKFHNIVKPIFELIKIYNLQRQGLKNIIDLLLSKLSTIED